jgi:hypothetical protein
MKITERQDIVRVTVERDTGEDWPAVVMSPGKVLDPIGMRIEFGRGSLAVITVTVVGFRMLKNGRRTARLTPVYREKGPRELQDLVGQIWAKTFPDVMSALDAVAYEHPTYGI